MHTTKFASPTVKYIISTIRMTILGIAIFGNWWQNFTECNCFPKLLLKLNNLVAVLRHSLVDPCADHTIVCCKCLEKRNKIENSLLCDMLNNLYCNDFVYIKLMSVVRPGCNCNNWQNSFKNNETSWDAMLNSLLSWHAGISVSQMIGCTWIEDDNQQNQHDVTWTIKKAEKNSDINFLTAIRLFMENVHPRIDNFCQRKQMRRSMIANVNRQVKWWW